jgi:mannose-6-phosphate isomerase-like protein (cupin superfamily)
VDPPAIARSETWHVVRDDDRYVVRDALSGRFTVSETRLYAGKETRGHSHPHDEVYYFQSGSGVFIVGGEARDVGAGDVGYVPPGAFHQVRADTELVFLCFFEGTRESA